MDQDTIGDSVMFTRKQLTLSDISHRKRLFVALFAVTAIIAVTFIYYRMKVHALSGLTFDQVDDDSLIKIKAILSGKDIDDNLDKFYSVEVRTLLFEHVKTEYTAVTTALKSIGIIIVFVKVCEKLIRTMERGEMTEEQWIGVILTFAIPVVLIAEYDNVIKAVQMVGDTVYGMISASRQNLSGQTETFIESVVGTGFKPEWPTFSLLDIGGYLNESIDLIVKQMKAFAIGFSINFVLEVATFFVNLTVMTKVIINYASLALRFLFMPLAIANISSDGARSAGMRYIIRYVAVYIELASISLVVHIVFYCYIALMSGSIALTFGQCIVFYILLAPATKGALNASSRIIEQSLGADMH